MYYFWSIPVEFDFFFFCEHQHTVGTSRLEVRITFVVPRRNAGKSANSRVRSQGGVDSARTERRQIDKKETSFCSRVIVMSYQLTQTATQGGGFILFRS